MSNAPVICNQAPPPHPRGRAGDSHGNGHGHDQTPKLSHGSAGETTRGLHYIGKRAVK